MIKSITEIPIQTYNNANTTKWIFNLPIAKLFNLEKETHKNGQLLEYPLNCQDIRFPEFVLGTTQVSFLNYSFDISTRQNLTKKTLDVKFLLSENWIQYLFLLKWFEMCDYTRYNENKDDYFVEVDLGNGVKKRITKAEWEEYMYSTGQHPYHSTQGPIVDCNLYLMDNFMNRIGTFNFEGCFITNIKNVELNYAKTADTESLITFTMSFYKINFYSNSKEVNNLLPGGGIYLND